MRLRTLLDGLPVSLPTADCEVEELTIDVREVTPGTLFIARRGYYGDTHRHLAQALSQGACGLVVSDLSAVPPGCAVPVMVVEADDPFLGLAADRFYGAPSQALKVIGITGTNGKTTVSRLVVHMLEALGQKTALLGTISYHLPGRSWPAVNTTPDALFIHRMARQALDAGAEVLVLEVSSHALDLARVAELRFDAVGFTHLTPEHLDHHKTLLAYFQAKRRLFDEALTFALAEGKTPTAVAVLRGDGHGEAMLEAVPPGAKKLGVGASPLPGARPLPRHRWFVRRQSGPSPTGQGIEVLKANQRLSGHLPLLGDFDLENLALALGLVEAVAPKDERAAMLASIASFPGVPGRLELAVDARCGGRPVFVDYAHTQDALKRALGVLQGLNAGPITAVVGCGGDRDPSKRGPMAERAVDGAAHAIFTSDNPRSEAPEAILAAMCQAVPLGAATVEVDRERAIALALTDGHNGPLLIAGKGHERTQEQAGVKRPFDDGEVARRLVAWRHHRGDLSEPCQVPWLCGYSVERVATLVGGVVRRAGPKMPLGVIEAGRKHPLGFGVLTVGVGPVDHGLSAWIEAEDAHEALTALAVAVMLDASARPGGLEIEEAGEALQGTESALLLGPAQTKVRISSPLAARYRTAQAAASALPNPIPVPR